MWIGWTLAGAGALGTVRATRPLRAHEAALFQWVNPKAWLFAIIAASLFLPSSGPRQTALLSIVLTTAVVSLPCLAVWALCGSALRNWLEPVGRRRAFHLVMAAALLVTAALMLEAPP